MSVVFLICWSKCRWSKHRIPNVKRKGRKTSSIQFQDEIWFVSLRSTLTTVMFGICSTKKKKKKIFIWHILHYALHAKQSYHCSIFFPLLTKEEREREKEIEKNEQHWSPHSALSQSALQLRAFPADIQESYTKTNHFAFRTENGLCCERGFLFFVFILTVCYWKSIPND